MWKGGRLKLEKAKEHYLLRLKREWAEDAKLSNDSQNNKVAAAVENPHPSEKLSKFLIRNSDKQIHIFFPKLRKASPLFNLNLFPIISFYLFNLVYGLIKMMISTVNPLCNLVPRIVLSRTTLVVSCQAYRVYISHTGQGITIQGNRKTQIQFPTHCSSSPPSSFL